MMTIEMQPECKRVQRLWTLNFSKSGSAALVRMINAIVNAFNALRVMSARWRRKINIKEMNFNKVSCGTNNNLILLKFAIRFHWNASALCMLRCTHFMASTVQSAHIGINIIKLQRFWNHFFAFSCNTSCVYLLFVSLAFRWKH